MWRVNRWTAIGSKTAAVCLAAALLFRGHAVASDPAPANLMQITLERKTDSGVKTIEPQHVFNRGDTLHFRIQPAYDGYLYVLDLTTSGTYVLLFPRADTGRDNHVEHGRSYLVPSTEDGWFQIGGPAGHETLYFVMSPSPLAPNPLPPALPQGTPPANIKPRCDDALFRSRGECMDIGAGARAVPPSLPLPGPVGALAKGASRDLTFTQKGQSTEVAGGETIRGPVVYEFLLAHN